MACKVHTGYCYYQKNIIYVYIIYMVFNLIYGRVYKVKWGWHVGITRPPSLMLHKRFPPIIEGINKVKLEVACGYHAAPIVCCKKRETAQMRQCVDFTLPHSCCCKKESPPNDRVDEKAWCVGCTPLIHIWKAK